ncbi:MAG TPA: tyrosine-protein phosphatase [Kofleriaceae bacterium]|nr:tyrosine-protein phosphatase [Kofleriaceae bacterium]
MTTLAPLTWLSVATGRLAIGHRPKVAALPGLGADGCTHVVTLLAEREGAAAVGAAVRAAGLGWIWWPLANGDPLPRARDGEARAFLASLLAVLTDGSGVYVHCAAGIHRTGMLAYALLRQAGLDAGAARAALRRLRAVTADGVKDVRLAWGDRLADRA